MGVHRSFLNPLVAAFVLLFALPAFAGAQTQLLDQLFDELQTPDLPNWEQVEGQIWTEWSKSGSSAMDLLLKRGRDAMEAGDFAVAIEHLTALTDHAPDFAEGYNARATAYFRDGLYGPALADIARTLTLNPRHFGALTGLGTIFEELGDEEKALDAFRAASAIQPHDPDLLEAIARLEKQVSGLTL